jgi:hypothetical protein
MTLAFFMKWIAPLLAVLAIVGIIYGKGSLDSKHAAELKTVTDQLAIAQDTIALEKAVRAKDTVIAQANAVFLTDLNTNIDGLNSYAKALPDADRECLSGADTDKLRALWR